MGTGQQAMLLGGGSAIPPANLRFWFKADSLVLADGDPVSTWTDSGPNGNNATASTTQRPTYRSNGLNGYPAVDFDGSLNWLDLTSPITSATTTFTGFAVIKADTGQRHALFGGVSGAMSFGVDSSNGNKLFVGPNFPLSDYAASPTGFYLVAFDSNTSASHFWLQGQAAGTAAANTPTQSLSVIGKSAGSSITLFDGKIFELILYGSVLGSTDRQTVLDYLHTKYHADGYTSGPVSTANCTGWWKADALSLANNDPVNSWADSSGYGLTLTPGNAPTFKTNLINSLPAVRFDASNDQLLLPFGLNSGAPLTIFAVAQPLATGTFIGGPVSSFGYQVNGAVKQIGVRVGQNVLGTATNALSTVAFEQSNVQWDNANITFRKSSAANGTAAFSLVIALAMTEVGANGVGTELFNGDIAELAVYCRILSGGEISAIEAALASKYAIS